MLAPGFALAASAQTSITTASTQGRTAVISFQAAVGQTNEGQRDLADLQKKFEPRTAELKALNDEIEKLQKDLQSHGAALTDAERASRTRIIDEKKKKLQRLAEDLRNEGNQELQRLMGDLGKKVYDEMVSYAKEQGYTVVLDASEQQQSSVLYAADTNNIGKAVIDRYNAKSGVPAPAAVPQTAPKAPASR
jgi:outer membrane protein